MFVFQKSHFPHKSIFKHHVKVFFKENEMQNNFKSFVENHGLTSLEKSTISYYVKMTLLQSKTSFLQFIIHVQVFFEKENETPKKFQIFVENQGLTPQEKWTIWHFFKMTFLQSRKPFFPFRTLFSIMCRSFSKKMRLRRMSNF